MSSPHRTPALHRLPPELLSLILTYSTTSLLTPQFHSTYTHLSPPLLSLVSLVEIPPTLLGAALLLALPHDPTVPESEYPEDPAECLCRVRYKRLTPQYLLAGAMGRRDDEALGGALRVHCQVRRFAREIYGVAKAARAANELESGCIFDLEGPLEGEEVWFLPIYLALVQGKTLYYKDLDFEEEVVVEEGREYASLMARMGFWMDYVEERETFFEVDGKRKRVRVKHHVASEGPCHPVNTGGRDKRNVGELGRVWEDVIWVVRIHFGRGFYGDW